MIYQYAQYINVKIGIGIPVFHPPVSGLPCLPPLKEELPPAS